MSWKNTEDSSMVAISANWSNLASCKIIYNPENYEVTYRERIFLVDPAGSTSTIRMVLEVPERGICSEMIFSPNNQNLAAQSSYIWKIDQALPIANIGPGRDQQMAFNLHGSLLGVENQVIDISPGNILKELAVRGEILRPGLDSSGYRLFGCRENKVMYWKVANP